MKTVQQLEAYFRNELWRDVKRVENKRRFLIVQLGIVVLLSLAANAVIGYVWFHAEELGITSDWRDGWFVLGILLICVMCFVVMYEIRRNKGFYYDFKNLIIERIVQFVHPSFVYKAHRSIPVNRFVESHLFQHLPSKKYFGDDYVSGTLSNGTKIEFSEVVANYIEKGGNEKGKSKPLFKGLFFIATLKDLKFSSTAMIVPKGTDLTKSHFSKKMPLLKVGLQSKQFDSHFDLYSDSAENKNHVVTKDLLQDLTDFEEQTKSQIMVSFAGNNVYVGITFEKDLFEPQLFHSLLDFSVIKEYYEVLYNAISIIERITPEALEDAVKSGREISGSVV